MSAPAVTPVVDRSTKWLVGVAVLSLGASAWLLVAPGESSVRHSIDADGYSRSAIGHRGLLQFLRREGEVVVQTRLARPLGPCGLYVIAEPHELDAADDRRLTARIEQAPATLVVLPKRRGFAERPESAWVDRVEWIEAEKVEATLERVGRWLEERPPGLVRSEQSSNWRHPPSWPEPALASPVQLLQGRSRVEPIVACDEGILLGKLGDIYVLSDPDLLANHGLHRGDNAELVLAMLSRLKQRGAIVFDETVHGHLVEPSIWRAAGQYPFVLVSCQLLLLLAVTAAAARGRFGAVLPDVPAIAAGKRFLIDNTASLLTHAGSAAPSLRRYGRQRLRVVAEALQAPRGLGDAECRAFVLARLPEDERQQLAALLDLATAAAARGTAVATARRIRHLTEGLLHARS